MKHRLKHYLEYGLLRGACGFVSMLPYRLALLFSVGLARLLFAVGGSRKREAIRRIQFVLGADCAKPQAREIAWQSLRNVALNLAEIIYVGARKNRSLPELIDFQQAQNILRAFAQTHPGRGAIFACPHMGNWELAGILAPSVGVELFTLTGVQKNPLVQNFLQNMRHAPGVELIERGGGASTLKKIFSNLRNGKFLAIMPDLRSRHEGVPVRFFGGVANLYQGMGHFAHQTKVPIFLAVMKRSGWSHHSIELYGPFEPDLTLDKDTDATRLSQLVMDIIETEIRKNPGQWFWFNKRWILDPFPN